MLSLERVTHVYDGTLVLDAVTLQVEPGQLVGVLGPNGAGKSTLLQIALGLLTPTKGEVRIDDVALAALDIHARAKAIAAVLQGESAAFAFSARELVLLGLHVHRPRFGAPSPQALQAVDAALTAAHASAYADRPLHTLSGGERQRVFIARALAQRTRYLALDEPTTYFDIAHTLHFASQLKTLTDKGILWVLHDPALALRFCDRLLLLDQGRTVAFGPPAEVLTPERILAVFGVRAEIVPDSTGARHLLLL